MFARVTKRVTVCVKTVNRERAPYKSLLPLYHRRRPWSDVQRIWEKKNRAKPWRRIGNWGTGRLGGGDGVVTESD